MACPGAVLSSSRYGFARGIQPFTTPSAKASKRGVAEQVGGGQQALEADRVAVVPDRERVAG